MTPSASRPLIAVLLALIAALLGCGLSGGPVETVPQPGSFSTATPGGSVSIWLVTPTGGAPAAGPAAGSPLTTPIGPPTAAPAGGAPGAAACPPPGTATLPVQPPPFTEFAELVLDYLSAGGPTTILEATLRGWGALSEFGGLVRADRDFTGDGVPEVFLVLLDPASTDRFPPPGDLLIYACENSAYRLIYQAGFALDEGAPTVISADDLNGDGVNDMLYATQACGASTCFTDVVVIAWNPRLNVFDRLTNTQVSEPFADVRAQDLEGDGIYEVIVTSGMIASVGAGPQRIITTTLKWDGALYVPVDRVVAPAEYRIHVIHDGDDRLLAGDYGAAIELYQRAATVPGLFAWQYPNESVYLNAFARYRLVQAYALQGDLGAAQSTHDQLVNEFSLPPTPIPEGGAYEPPPPGFVPIDDARPGAAFVRMANLFWQEFSRSRDAALACQGVRAYALANPASLDVLNSFGYANRSYTPADVCPF
ncbi:MAG: hypothetical protein Kow00124_23500 [Anaerolineae bacterium]